MIHGTGLGIAPGQAVSVVGRGRKGVGVATRRTYRVHMVRDLTEGVPVTSRRGRPVMISLDDVERVQDSIDRALTAGPAP
jgi:hypothetical protein